MNVTWNVDAFWEDESFAGIHETADEEHGGPDRQDRGHHSDHDVRRAWQLHPGVFLGAGQGLVHAGVDRSDAGWAEAATTAAAAAAATGSDSRDVSASGWIPEALTAGGTRAGKNRIC